MSQRIKTTPIRFIIGDGILLSGLVFGLGALLYWLPALGVIGGTLVIIALILALVDLLLRLFFPGYDEWSAKCRRVAGRIPWFVTVLVIWGALLWYFAPEQGHTSKPMGALTLGDLGGIIFWIWLVVAGGRILFAMLKDHSSA